MLLMDNIWPHWVEPLGIIIPFCYQGYKNSSTQDVYNQELMTENMLGFKRYIPRQKDSQSDKHCFAFSFTSFLFSIQQTLHLLLSGWR